jgi:outer membrane immunogenic protein
VVRTPSIVTVTLLARNGLPGRPWLNGCRNNTGGWLVGAGFEYAFTNNWTVKLEYDYVGLGNRTFVIPATAPILANDTFTSGNNRNVQMVKVGFNYLFNWGAPGRY